jgi:hypothetical protein
VETCANQGDRRDQPRPDLTSPCVAESGGPECGVETCANQEVCRDQPRTDLTCSCVAESGGPDCGWIHVLTGVSMDRPIQDFKCSCVAEIGGPECGVETCANQGVCRDQPRPDQLCNCDLTSFTGPTCLDGKKMFKGTQA